MWLARLFSVSRQIDEQLAAKVAPTPVASYRTAVKQLPAYRFVDLYRAIEAHAAERRDPFRIESENDEDLNTLMHGKRHAWTSRKVTQAKRLPWHTGPESEALLPVDCFWVLARESGGPRLVVRLKYDVFQARSSLEVAATDPAVGESLMEEIIARSVRDSVYRNQTLQISFESGTKDEYGDIEKPEQLRVSFARFTPVADEDLVVEDEVRRVLLRNVVELHERRELLKAHGVPVRRGVLLFGPPGTGKTYACRFLCGKLPGATRIMVTGSALLQVGQVFQLARLLQPAVLFLEDVDLVFMSREVNLYSSVLGDLLDHMDGLRPFEDVGFVLTTNAIDRMESAVRDRPGRISQCIFFGPPTGDLRRRYLSYYLRRYDVAEVDLDALVADSDGATQAFLKEWVHRAVQVGCDRLAEPSSDLALTTADFKEALREMRAFTDPATARIIGFHG